MTNAQVFYLFDHIRHSNSYSKQAIATLLNMSTSFLYFNDFKYNTRLKLVNKCLDGDTLSETKIKELVLDLIYRTMIKARKLTVNHLYIFPHVNALMLHVSSA